MSSNTDVIFFLPYWDKKNPTADDQTGFLFCELFEEEECLKLGGKVFTHGDFYQKSPKDVIKDAIRNEHPQWTVGIENTATLLLSFHRQKKILINPTVTLNDLNWVTADTIDNTYAFFSSDHEKDYEIYSKVYSNAAFYPLQKKLHISDVSDIIKNIID